MTTRMNRRIFGMLKKRLDEADFDQVRDGRDDRGKRWELSAVLRTAVGATLAGAQSLAQVEAISARLSSPIRRLLGIHRRLPDTTLRNVLCAVEPNDVRQPLHAVIRRVYRRKALEPEHLPFAMVSVDGKHISIGGCDDWYAQRQSQDEGARLVGVVRTVTATLTSHRARPIIDTVPIPAPTNEMGAFETALDALCSAYRGLELFQLVSYDAGACSAHNAQAAVSGIFTTCSGSRVRSQPCSRKLDVGSVVVWLSKPMPVPKISSAASGSCDGYTSAKPLSNSTVGSTCGQSCGSRWKPSMLLVPPCSGSIVTSSRACLVVD